MAHEVKLAFMFSGCMGRLHCPTSGDSGVHWVSESREQ